jgi:hypothetical protein
MDDDRLNEIMARMVEALRRSREMNTDMYARLDMAAQGAGERLVDEIENFLKERNETGTNGQSND